MDKIEKIRAEIEMHRQAIRVLNEHTAPEQMSKTCIIFQYSDSILSELLSFLDTLSEEPDKSLKETVSEQICVAADKHIRRVVDAAGHPGWDWATQDIADAFIAGAEWQEEQDLKYISEIHRNGYNLCKEQMLKDAVEGVVCYGSKGAYIKTYFLGEYDTDVYGNPGDKVRIVVLKENEQ